MPHVLETWSLCEDADVGAEPTDCLGSVGRQIAAEADSQDVTAARRRDWAETLVCQRRAPSLPQTAKARARSYVTDPVAGGT
jgi:hypothetical protein